MSERSHGRYGKLLGKARVFRLKSFAAEVRFSVLKVDHYVSYVLESDIVRERDRNRLALRHVPCCLLQASGKYPCALSEPKLVVVVVVPQVSRVAHVNVHLDIKLGKQFSFPVF